MSFIKKGPAPLDQFPIDQFRDPGPENRVAPAAQCHTIGKGISIFLYDGLNSGVGLLRLQNFP